MQRTPETVCAEADRLVNGPRRADYDHPMPNFRRTAAIWTAVLGEKLQPGVNISPMDVALCMIGVKLAREAFSHKRDNLVDIAGYAATLELVWDAVTDGYTEAGETVQDTPQPEECDCPTCSALKASVAAAAREALGMAGDRQKGQDERRPPVPGASAPPLYPRPQRDNDAAAIPLDGGAVHGPEGVIAAAGTDWGDGIEAVRRDAEQLVRTYPLGASE